MTNPTPEQEFAILFDLYRNRELTENQADRFLELLKSSPSVPRTAYDNLKIDFLLRQKFCPGRGVDVSPGMMQGLDSEPGSPKLFDSATFAQAFELVRVQTPSSVTDALALQAAEQAADELRASLQKPATVRRADDKGGRSFLPLRFLLPAALLVFGILIFNEWNPSDRHAGALPGVSVERPAVIAGLDDVRWAPGTKPPQLGEPLPPGSLRFESGSMELLFFSGVRGVVEGPAELLLIDAKQVFCRQGKWSVTVPPQGSGFEIQTPHWTVRDIGTKFFVDVDGESCDLHVLQGTVEMQRPRSGKSDKLVFTTEQAARFLENKLLAKAKATTEYFVTRSEMRRRSDAFLFRTRRPEEVAATLKSAAVRTLDFDRDSLGDASLFGGIREPDENVGVIAWRPTGPTDRIRLRPCGKANAVSIVLRVRLDRLKRSMNPLVMGEGSRRGGLVLHVQPHGKLLAGLRYNSGALSGIFETPVIVTESELGRWMDIVLTVDGRTGRLVVYLDGDVVLSEKLPAPCQIDLDRVDLASWKSQSTVESPVHQIDGAVQWAAVYDRVLGVEEVRALERM